MRPEQRISNVREFIRLQAPGQTFHVETPVEGQFNVIFNKIPVYILNRVRNAIYQYGFNHISVTAIEAVDTQKPNHKKRRR